MSHFSHRLHFIVREYDSYQVIASTHWLPIAVHLRMSICHSIQNRWTKEHLHVCMRCSRAHACFAGIIRSIKQVENNRDSETQHSTAHRVGRTDNLRYQVAGERYKTVMIYRRLFCYSILFILQTTKSRATIRLSTGRKNMFKFSNIYLCCCAFHDGIVLAHPCSHCHTASHLIFLFRFTNGT